MEREDVDMNFRLPTLPFNPDALTPHISPETIEFHYGKHHRAYVDRLNGLLEHSSLNGHTLEEIIFSTQVQGLSIFDNASQAWNHTFYWLGLSPHGGTHPVGPLYEQVMRDFGSGWAWLVKGDQGRLEIVCSSNADTPIVEKKKPILVCDLWEHAYYLDYRNAKGAYLDHFWKIVNWKFAAANYQADRIPNMTQFMTDPAVMEKGA